MNTEGFLKFDYKKDHLDEFIWPFLMRLTDNTDKLYALNKITAKTDNFKIRFDDLLKIGKYEHRRIS